MKKAEAMAMVIGTRVIVTDKRFERGSMGGTVLKAPTFSGAKWSSHFKIALDNGEERMFMFSAVNTVKPLETRRVEEVKALKKEQKVKAKANAKALDKVAKASKQMAKSNFTLDNAIALAEALKVLNANGINFKDLM